MMDQGIVYYIRRGGLIKIGYTARFVNRMRALAPDELLAVEPGNLRLEAGRHQQFAAFRVEGREWFAPEPELLAHIALMASIYETPPLPPMPVPRIGNAALDEWGGIPGKFLVA